jgi:cytidyltransferase-like protein
MQKTAVFLWRFQPFHIGHYSIVEKILTEYERLMLVIGSAEKSWTEDNPWTLQEREEIIRASIPLELQERMDIIWLDDVPDDDEWCENLKKLLQHWKLHIENYTLITGNEWVRDICARHSIQTEWIDSYEIDISGTRIREVIRKWESADNFLLVPISIISEKS